MKQHIVKTLLLFIITIFLFNCEKDDSIIETQKTNNTIKSQFNASKISKTKLLSNTIIKNKLEAINKTLSKQTLNKDVTSNEYGFTIDTEQAVYIEHTEINYHSYTFPLQRITENTTALENLVLSLQTDGTYKAILVSYDITGQEKLDLINRISVDLTNKISSVQLDDDGLIDTIFSKVAAFGDCVGILTCPYGDDHPATQVCIDQDRGDLYLDTSMCTEDELNNDNSDGGGSSTSGTSPGGNPGSSTSVTSSTSGQTSNGGTGNNSNDNTGNAPDTTLPVLSTLDEIELCLQFNSGFTPEMSSWLQSQPRGTIIKINNLIQSNSCSEEVKELMIKIILSGMDETLLTVTPFFKYPDNSNYSEMYPELTILLKEYIPYLRNNTKLLNTISRLTGVSINDIKNDFTWGEGPVIHIEQLGVVNNQEIKGKFNPSTPNKIFLDIDLVNILEELAAIANPTEQQITQLQLLDGLVTFAVCLHEYVHYADNAFDGSMQDNEDLELGLLFEELFVGGYYEFDQNGNVILIPVN